MSRYRLFTLAFFRNVHADMYLTTLRDQSLNTEGEDGGESGGGGCLGIYILLKGESIKRGASFSPANG